MAKTRTSGQGRPKGVPNKKTAELKEIASKYSVAAVEELARLAGLMMPKLAGADSDQAKVSALRELLDRGHGKPSQALEHSGTINLSLADRIESARKRG